MLVFVVVTLCTDTAARSRAIRRSAGARIMKGRETTTGIESAERRLLVLRVLVVLVPVLVMRLAL